MTSKITHLHQSKSIEVKPKPPFNFDGTFCKPSNFPMPDHYYEPGTYWRSLRVNSNIYGIKINNTGRIDKPEVLISVYYKPGLINDEVFNLIINEVSFRFDLNSDYSEFTNKFHDDEIIGSSIRKLKGMRVASPYSLYEFLIVTTVLQNTVVRRSVQMMNNLFNKFGAQITFDDKQVFAFWPVEIINESSEEELRNLKVGYRAKTFKRQAQEFAEDRIDIKYLRKMNKTELRKNLLKIYGIGPATVQYLMFEQFHHFDICEYIPPWEQKIYSKLLFNQTLVDTDKILKKIKNKWGKWHMLALHYLFENLFWIKNTKKIEWLEALIEL